MFAVVGTSIAVELTSAFANGMPKLSMRTRNCAKSVARVPPDEPYRISMKPWPNVVDTRLLPVRITAGGGVRGPEAKKLPALLVEIDRFGPAPSCTPVPKNAKSPAPDDDREPVPLMVAACAAPMLKTNATKAIKRITISNTSLTVPPFLPNSAIESIDKGGVKEVRFCLLFLLLTQ